MDLAGVGGLGVELVPRGGIAAAAQSRSQSLGPGRGGTAEGVVVGMLAAWGAATLEDVRRIRAIERSEGRRYFAACRRPTGVGNRLVWLQRPAAKG